MDSWQNCCLPVTARTIHKMLSSIKQVKVGRGIPMRHVVKEGMPEHRNVGTPECRNTGMPEHRNAGTPECRNTGMPEHRNAGTPETFSL